MNVLTYNDSAEYTINSVVVEDEFVNIAGSAAHFHKPNLNSQVVDAKSFAKSIELFKNNTLIPALNYNHDANSLVGAVTDLNCTDETLEVSARLNKNIPLVSNMLLPMIEAGDLKSFSTEGYIDLRNCKQFEDGTYYAPEFKLTAVAIVSVPADHESRFTIRNYFDDQYKLNNIVKYYFF